MSKDEFRWNKKRKHYAYLFKKLGDYRINILLTTDPIFRNKKKGKLVIRKNICLFKQTNPLYFNNKVKCYIINHKPYIDNKNSFFPKAYYKWKWDKNDKRIIKRFKKYRKYKKYFDSYGK